jgi:beta-glucanase (GH16 family)
MLGDNIDIVGWPHCGEIDIMEMIGHEPSTVHGTAHWGPQGNSWSFNNGNDYKLSGEKFIDEYHVFSILWELDKITYFVDDVEYFTLTKQMVNGDYPFNAPFFFIFNVAVGGTWPGYPDETTQFPQRMVVDYVRVFERN